MADSSSQKALSEFISESQETIETLDRELLRLDDARASGDADPEVLNAVFRAAHTLKGLSAMFGVDRMATLAHALEDRLDALRMGKQRLVPATLDLLLATPDLFQRIIKEVSSGAPAETADAAERLVGRLREAVAAPVGELPDLVKQSGVDAAVVAVLTEYEEHRLRANLAKGCGVFRVRAAFDIASFDTGLDDLKRRLKPHGEVIATLPSTDPGDASAIGFDVLFGSAAGIDAVRRAGGPHAVVLELCAAAAGPQNEGGADRAKAQDSTVPATALTAEEGAGTSSGGADSSLRSASQAVRVDIRKLDRLMNVIGELVLVKTSLMRVAERLRSGEQGGTLALELHRESRSLERKLADLQSGILEVRMVPVGQIFDKLSRMVRKLTRELGKEIEFQVRGSDVELDKLIVEDLSDPLMHLIRNALDHAIEAPDKRIAAGKPRAGRVTLAASQKGSHVQIVVEDDGVGIDEGRIREVAVQRGLATADAVKQMSHREVMNLIFVPGFSTARQVTALSGRGVGMDVVKNNIANLSGIIDLTSERGKGTRFEITLPVTLAIIRALVVGVAGRTYAVPLNSVLEILTVAPYELRTVETREVLSLRGSTLPLVRLSRLFDLGVAPGEGPMYVVVVGLAQERLAVAVDALVGQQDIVVKPLGRALHGIRGIAGATDLGNRQTVLVLDVGAVIEEVVRGEKSLREAG